MKRLALIILLLIVISGCSRVQTIHIGEPPPIEQEIANSSTLTEQQSSVQQTSANNTSSTKTTTTETTQKTSSKTNTQTTTQLNTPFENPVFPSATNSLPICGNSQKEEVEICDGNDLSGKTCVSLGFTSGILSCKSDCSAYDKSKCI